MLSRMSAIEERMARVEMRMDSTENNLRDLQSRSIKGPETTAILSPPASSEPTPRKPPQPWTLFVKFNAGSPELHDNFIKLFKRRGGEKWRLTQTPEEASAALYVVFISGGGRVDLTTVTNAVKANSIHNSVVLALVAGRETIQLPRNLAAMVTSAPLGGDWFMDWVTKGGRGGIDEKQIISVIDSVVRHLENPQSSSKPSWMQAAMQNKLSCTFCNSELVASNAHICGNRPECQTLYCNDQCAQRDWDQHYAQCSTLKLIQSGIGPETTEEEAQRLRRKLAKLREEAEREEAAAAERQRAAREEAAREEAAAAERQRAAREEAERERAANEEVLSSLRELKTLHEERLALAKREAKLKDTLKKAQTEAARRRQLHKAKMKQDWPDNMVIEDE